MSDLDSTITALADPVRRQVVELLAKRSMRSGELAEAVGATPSALSKHLRVLRQRGVVEEFHPEFDARVRIYTLRSAPMIELRTWLEAAERGWSEQLSSFAEFVEGEDA
ncbi:putative ArsR family transcriptional regulator [Gordonia effusa NBRC 100432]|uniref:Putative ArsR family transcriptional regulator n=1 Tax=Gordonia effusa NBRC 100432 TaxID=1077974 RepID=H0R211_9ACTN|nr:metalloregulator ArsR/SmtB family transcription factor [Gordonia effusa]GAB19116.1 putative ArsR family transcriptional regulator [Gordonia effusa NBRC 100432]